MQYLSQNHQSTDREKIFILLLLVFLVVGLFALPYFADMALINAMVLVCIAALYAMGYNLLWGQAGLISFGHATYFAFGASCTIMMMAGIEGGSSFPTPFLPLVGGVASFLIGIVAGWFATIRTGVYFAMITVAITELARAIVQRWDTVFGGEAGITSIRTAWGPFGFQKLIDVYYFTLVWTIICIILLWFLQKSPVGMVIRGIREQEERVRFLGYDTHALKTLVFAISAGVSGMAGGLLAFTNESTNVTLYEGAYSTAVLINTVIGGAGVFLGPVVGATLTTLFGYYVANLTFHWLLYMGLLFIVIVVCAPRGITGLGVDAVMHIRSGARLPWRLICKQILGWLLLSIGSVMIIEMIGAVLQPSYGALARSSGVAWPPVNVFGINWSPSSPLTLSGIALIFVVGLVLLRDKASSAHRNVLKLAGAIVQKPEAGS